MELQQGKKRQMPIRQKNQPGDQQHQKTATPPTTTPRVEHKISRDRDGVVSGEKEKIILYQMAAKF